MSTPVFVCTSSFGARYVRQHGQAHAARLARDAGASGVEIRQELIDLRDQPLSRLGADIAELGLDCHYSSTELLWLGEHLNDRIEESIEVAQTLGAKLLKVAIGNLPEREEVRDETLAKLDRMLEGRSLVLALENDQTPRAGTPEALLGALDAFDRAGIYVGITFDIGNWRWLGINAHDAAQMLGERVIYVHCKGVVQRQQSLHATPPSALELAEWSAYWHQFPAQVARSIEFPLVSSDDIDHPDETLVAAARPWIERLAHF
ncbi:sugar phosphate isomerase/epimerase family protein [Halotalea alkalilenta]|uniref:Xylose isomerase-like TIM barrel domain-containing protein n=1 Tax=Halotalea alkalilenta TaxID=376489 RepID=A0A172YHA2_9GAMM|nr:TIM barrel protein [Halotalea alkalilenta]ANF58587.1 hypothetical protein A5892_14830 [Halotalea alkalilenta]